jgi:hypothetical protein
MIETLIHALEDQKLAPTWRDVADTVWLAALYLARAGGPDTTLGPPTGFARDQELSPANDGNASGTESQNLSAKPPVLAKPSDQQVPSADLFPEEKKKGPATVGMGRGLGLGGGLAVRVPAVRALPDSLNIGRALRPLMRSESSPFTQVFDEEATVRRSADFDIWIPVLRAAPARVFEVALVIDAAVSMAVWSATLREFRETLGRLGAFRDVRTWWLRPGPEPAGALMIAPESGSARDCALRSPHELRDPTGRRLVLLASDCVSDPWRDGRACSLIAGWGRTQPVAVVQMLPRSLWRQTGLGRSVRAPARAPIIGAPNARLDLELDGRGKGALVAVPVLTLDAEALGAWARMLTRPGKASVPAILLQDTPAPRLAPTPVPPRARPSPLERVERFTCTASRPAQELAACLAVVPLRLQIMRLVQHVMLPSTRPTHLAEVLLGGLMRVESSDQDSPDDLSFEFYDDVPEILIDRLEFPRAVETFNVVTRYFSEHFGAPLNFLAIVRSPERLTALNASNSGRPFAKVAARLLMRLGGRYAKLARRILDGDKGIVADLRGADLSGARLRAADLNMADLREADLSGADLSGARLRAADLSGARLRAADLSGADLHEADLSGADLNGADLGSAMCAHTVFGDVDLSEAKGLESITHDGPSTLGVDTLVRSRGRIPEAFFRGCGVPEALIEYLPSLLGAMAPIQFYSCFISYSTRDQDFAERLHSRMRDKGLRVWFAPEDIQGGRKIHEQIDEAIRVHDKLLLVLSAESMNSEWVRTEIRNVLRAEAREGRRKLFPIRLVGFEAIREWECFDAESRKDLAAEIRQYNIPDFSNWKDHNAFEANIARLLRDLQKVEEAPSAKRS